MNITEARDLAFRLFLRNVDPADIVQALAREHSYEVTAETVVQWTAERLKRTGQDPHVAKTVSAINEANRELWASAARPGVPASAKASYMQAIARNEERLMKIAGDERSISGTVYVSVAREDRCGARGRGKFAGLFCDEVPVEGRRRCRNHGGASPRAAEHPRFKHGVFSQGGGLGIFVEPFGDSEQRLIDRWRRDPEEALRLQLAEGAVVQRRALRAGAVEIYSRLGTMVATTARALVSLREVPPPERGLPKVVEVFHGRTAEDFEHDLEVIRREAAVGAGR